MERNRKNATILNKAGRANRGVIPRLPFTQKIKNERGFIMWEILKEKHEFVLVEGEKGFLLLDIVKICIVHSDFRWNNAEHKKK